MSVAAEFRLTADEARAILNEVSSVTGEWASVARELGAGENDIDNMQPAFEHEASRHARELVSA